MNIKLTIIGSSEQLYIYTYISANIKKVSHMATHASNFSNYIS